MGSFLLRRLPWVVFLLFTTSVIAFLLPRLSGGDPAIIIAGSDATLDQIEAVRIGLGLDRPLPVQYFEWLFGILAGDMGTSMITNRPISQLIMARLGSTMELTIAAAIVMVALGTGLGIWAGSASRGFGRKILDGLLSVLLATPPHVTGLVLILIVGVTYRLLPISGEVSLLRDPMVGLSFLLMPALALALPQAATIARLIQARMEQIRQEDFIELARAKGVPGWKINIDHVLRNSLGTAIVATGVRIGELLAGAVVIEAIFARNGLGMMAVSAVSSRDYEVVQILVLFAVGIAMITHLVSEICLAALDPRIRLEAK